MRQESLARNSTEADDQTSRSTVICSHPWWRGSEFDASPRLGLEIAPKSPPLNTMEASEKVESGQSKQETIVTETEGIIKRSHDKSPQGDQNLQQVATEFIIPHAQLELGHSVACAPYMYPETYYNGMVGPYGAQPMVNSQLVGMPHTRVLLPLEMAEEPVYVNAKQYHGILRRRQSRAKAELENKLIKVRKPYLHESRHQHAMRRARGCGGRFLNTKKADGSTSTAADSNSNSPADYLGGSSGGGELKTQVDQGICEGSYQQHARFHLSSFHQSISEERGEEGDCSGQQRSGMAVDQTPKRVLTI